MAGKSLIVWLPALQRPHLRKYLSCVEFHTDLRCRLPLRQPARRGLRRSCAKFVVTA
jgi:hypothetical protein